MFNKQRNVKFMMVFAVVVAFATLYFWFAGSQSELQSGTTANLLITLGKLAGLFLTLLLLTELLLVSRAPIFEKLKGFPGLNKIHRGFGISVIGFLVLHGVFLVWGYALRDNVGIIQQLQTFFTWWDGVAAAIISAIVLFAIGIISIPYIRKKLRYEIWYYLHLLIYPILLFSFGHQISSGDMSSGIAKLFWITIFSSVIGFFMWYRFGRPLFFYSNHQFRVEKIEKETDDVFSVYITGKSMETFKFTAGQYANFLFLQRGFISRHPFSFSTPFNGKNIRITVKSRGDFTNQIHTLHIGTPVIIDGPVGNTTLEISETKKYCFISGGIGITPIAAMIHSLQSPSDAILFSANRSKDDRPLIGELSKTGVVICEYLSDAIPKTRIDANEIKKRCSDIHERDIYVCGPPLMINDITDGLLRKEVSQKRIHSEEFNY